MGSTDATIEIEERVRKSLVNFRRGLLTSIHCFSRGDGSECVNFNEENLVPLSLLTTGNH